MVPSLAPALLTFRWVLQFCPPSTAPSCPALAIGSHLWRSLAFTYPGSVPTRYLCSCFGRKICSPVVLSRKRPSFGPARGIRSLKPSAAYFRLCALALVRQRTFFCLSYPWMLKFRRLSLVCVHRIGYSAFPFFPGQRRHALMLARIIKVSCAITLCRPRQHLSLSLHSTSHTRQPNAD